MIPIPRGWEGRQADNGRGYVYQKPGSNGNSDVIRIMDPTSRYPEGYIRYYNQHGQPLIRDGKPGDRASTHIPVNDFDEITAWPK